ncbi:response regulator [Pedobacter petrophilus]|uniref:Response regulator n=1 Tax=Pedobacter petrophilus TaxID=1908241 RepID=A0A7K0G3Z6_9SPHI|nr:response regulator [Pedobacter petrophilus]MRX78523.1 response regulator [Pedobacter petrophilus]
MKKRICVLEDSEEILEIIKIVLEDENYDVQGFGTVAAFMANYLNLKPDLCLLDVMLPDGNGIEVCEAIKKHPESAEIPVVVMTANSRMDKMRENCEANDFIAKPFDINDFANRINSLIFVNV